MRIAWICHFTNNQVQSHLNIEKKINEFAPWITELIPQFENDPEMELYIISPHRNLKHNVKSFIKSGIHYYFFNSGIPFIGTKYPSFFRLDRWTNFYLNKKIFSRIIRAIKPDIIHLHGIENAYYSSAAIQFLDQYPLLASIQGFISLSPTVKSSSDIRYRRKIEEYLLTNVSHFGVMAEFMPELIRKNNPSAKIYYHQYPTKLPEAVQFDQQKKYDFVFFARITKQKGIEDFIYALSKYKSKFGTFTAAIIGGCNNKYKKSIIELINKFEIRDEVDFLGFLPTQTEVHNIVTSSRITVLPTYNDIIPGTIVESMFLKVPSISYNVGGLPDINKKAESVALVEKGDIDGLVKMMNILLTDKNYYSKLVNNGRHYIENNFLPSVIKMQLSEIYKNLLNKN
jgi:glycosyltransferase involved in cell wall biosynthesis